MGDFEPSCNIAASEGNQRVPVELEWRFPRGMGRLRAPVENSPDHHMLRCAHHRLIECQAEWKTVIKSHSPERATLPMRRWQIAWLLGLGVLVNYFDRVNISVSQASLYTAFGISSITFGYLSGAYNWTYAMCQLPVGVLFDKFGVKKIGRISTFIWSLASFGAAAAPGVPSLFAARLTLGVGEAPTFPANAKAIGHWFPPKQRSFATSLFDAAAKFAPAIGVPLIGMVLLE